MHSLAFIIVASTLATIADVETGAFLQRARARSATVNAPKWVGLEYLAGQNGEDLIDAFCFGLWLTACGGVVYLATGTSDWPTSLLGLVPSWVAALLIAIRTTRERSREVACSLVGISAVLLALYLLIRGALYLVSMALA